MVEQLKKDMIDAMKNKDKEKLTVIRMVKAAMDQEHIDRKREINDDLLIDVVNKQIKMRKDSIEEFTKVNRSELAQKTQEEVDTLMKYLTEQLSDEEVLKIIDEAFSKIQPSGMKDMGKVMGIVTPEVKGKADMKKVSEIIRGKLQ